MSTVDEGNMKPQFLKGRGIETKSESKPKNKNSMLIDLESRLKKALDALEVANASKNKAKIWKANERIRDLELELRSWRDL